MKNISKMNKELLKLLERASGLVGNPGVNISSSTDIACDKWQEDYEAYIAKAKQQIEKSEPCFTIENIRSWFLNKHDGSYEELTDYLNTHAAAYARYYAIKVLEKAAENARIKRLDGGYPVAIVIDKDSITDPKNLEV